jgi:hypothetical protein
MIAAPPPHPPHHGGIGHGGRGGHGRPPGYYQPSPYPYPYPPVTPPLTCVQIPNPIAGAEPPMVWVSPLTGAACVPYLTSPLGLAAYV